MKPLEFNDKILWDMIDKLRDELNIARDGITDLNDVLKDLQAESIEQIKDNKRIRNTLVENAKMHDELRKENERLKELNPHEVPKEFHTERYEELDAEIKRLNRVNAELSDKLQAVNDDYNNDTKVHNDYADGLLVEIKELKAELETSKQLAKDLSVGGGMPMNDNI